MLKTLAAMLLYILVWILQVIRIAYSGRLTKLQLQPFLEA